MSNETKNEKMQSFSSMTRSEAYARIVQKQSTTVQRKEEVQKKGTRLVKFQLKGKKIPKKYHKLLRNTAACLVLALGIIGIRSLDTTVSNQIMDGLEAASSSEIEMEETGRLKFVNGENDTAVMAQYSLPLEGQVVESFAETEKDVKIMSEENAAVRAILSGTVVKTTADSIVIENTNGTRTTYSGIVPTVAAGDIVNHSDTVGQLEGEILCLETISGIGYVDSLDVKELNETVPDAS